MNAHHNERQEERYRRDDPEGENRGKPFPWREVLIGILIAGLGGLGGTVFALGEKNSEFKSLQSDYQTHCIKQETDKLRTDNKLDDIAQKVNEMYGWMKAQNRGRRD
jgi:hypothetical protein